MEDINYASYAMDDNIVANGSFEALTKSKNEAWKATSGATFVVENTDGIFKNQTEYNAKSVNPNYARINVTSAGAGIYNTGYVAVPMAVKEGTEYAFSAFIKADAAVEATVKVTDGTTAHWETKFNVPQGTEWIKYSRTVKAKSTKSENLRLEITFDKAATVYLDAVAFETKDSTVGIKNYIYDAIKDLSPKFIRFPGGCIIEGTDESEAYDWKNSIGAVQNGNNAGDDTVPAFSYKLDEDGTVKTATTYGEPATRKPNKDNWYGPEYYDMEYAIGFYEYFLLCDSVGASAVPVLNCGLSDQGGLKYKNPPHALAGRHNKKVEDYIHDAVDLIEFAKGGTDTKWGKIREQLGHAEPFAMDYLGIGNEQFGTEYFQGYYEKFLDSELFQNALKTYSVKPIVGNAMTLGDCENPARNSLGAAQAAARIYRNKHALQMPNLTDYGVHDQH
ncbi:MAG: carbohydrate binding domain-containing protein, partial [Clostridiales bacterium]|nr:carbohydrate binding domain-containing protein [Clostridiales bacterium]